MVTALYRGRAHGTLPSRLEALGIATEFMPGVLLSKMDRGRAALWARLNACGKARGAGKVGGPVAAGRSFGRRLRTGRARGAGRLSRGGEREVVETGVPAYGWRGFFDHQLRWLRTVRDVRPAGYAGLIFTHGLGWALLNRAGEWIEPAEPVAAGIEFFPAAGTGHDGGRGSAGRSRGASQSVAAADARCRCDGAVGGRASQETRSCGAGNDSR